MIKMFFDDLSYVRWAFNVNWNICVIIQICKTAIKQNALFSSSTVAGSTSPVTFLTEDERVMKETGKTLIDIINRFTRDSLHKTKRKLSCVVGKCFSFYNQHLDHFNVIMSMRCPRQGHEGHLINLYETCNITSS